jgi:hypothetical protein
MVNGHAQPDQRDQELHYEGDARQVRQAQGDQERRHDGDRGDQQRQQRQDGPEHERQHGQRADRTDQRLHQHARALGVGACRELSQANTWPAAAPPAMSRSSQRPMTQHR